MFNDGYSRFEKSRKRDIFLALRILVTGLSGFTGHYIKPELEAAGHTVVGLGSDLTDLDSLTREVIQKHPEAVIHLAGISSIDHENSNAFYEVNLIGTRNLLVALSRRAKNLTSVLLVSSANIYGNQSGGVLSETSPPNPCSDYAISKHAMEQMAHLWVDRLPLFVVRPFNYTGVGQSSKFLVPKIVEHFQKKLPQIELGNLDVSREFGDVRDVANIYRNLIECPPIGNVLNICTGRPYSPRELISCCEELTGHTLEVKVNPEFVRENEIKSLQGSCAALKTLVKNWEPRKLTDTLNWMMQDFSSDNG